MNSPQTLDQIEGLIQSLCTEKPVKLNPKIKSPTYPPERISQWSSAVADPSLPPVVRGQQHGPGGDWLVVGKWGVGVGRYGKWGKNKNGELKQKQKEKGNKFYKGTDEIIYGEEIFNSSQKGGRA